MNSYMSFEGFTSAAKSARLRRVASDGHITISGRKYFDADLAPHIGKHVKAFLDLEACAAICFTPFDVRYICSAKNAELWKAFLAEYN